MEWEFGDLVTIDGVTPEVVLGHPKRDFEFWDDVGTRHQYKPQFVVLLRLNPPLGRGMTHGTTAPLKPWKKKED